MAMLIRLENVHKRFGKFVAADDISLNFVPGTLSALLGPSGCGKTTLLRMIAGLEQPDSGQIYFDNLLATHQDVRERQVGFVFQHYALFRHMTVFENVAFGLRVKHRAQRSSRSQIREKVRSLLELVQLDQVAQRYPSQLSGGQRQRIALARALAVEPRVLLLDEPFGALDAQVRNELRRWLRSLHEGMHITSLFVTHDQSEALDLADRVILMRYGKVEQEGTPEAVYHGPANPFVYGFLGRANCIEGLAHQGYISIDDAKFVAPDYVNAVNLPVLTYIRPHEIELAPPTSGVWGLPAKVRRIFSHGATVQVELEREKGLRPIDAELPFDRWKQLTIREGDRMLVQPKAFKAFPKT